MARELTCGPLALTSGGMRGSSGVDQQLSTIWMSVAGATRVDIAQTTSSMFERVDIVIDDHDEAAVARPAEQASTAMPACFAWPAYCCSIETTMSIGW